MKISIMALVIAVIGLGSQAQAQSWTKLTCVYRAAVSNGMVSDVVIRLTQDGYGSPRGGSLTVSHPDGSTQRVDIPAAAIASMAVDETLGVELAANIHVRSHNVDMVLNYAGNDFLYDAQEWLGVYDLRLPGLLAAYEQMADAGFLAPPVMAQMTGSVRWNGQLRKIASSKLACSSSF